MSKPSRPGSDFWKYAASSSDRQLIVTLVLAGFGLVDLAKVPVEQRAASFVVRDFAVTVLVQSLDHRFGPRFGERRGIGLFIFAVDSRELIAEQISGFEIAELTVAILVERLD